MRLQRQLALELADALARAVALTHRAGRAAGRLWFRHGLPLLLALADGISWLVALIDWAEALAVAAVAGRALLALLLTLVADAHRLLVALSAAMGHRYAALVLGRPTSTVAVPAAAAVAGVELLAVLQSLPRPCQNPFRSPASFHCGWKTSSQRPRSRA